MQGSPKTFGNYRIVRELSRGGQGVVYEATHVHLGTRVAIKRLLDREQRAVERFRQEAQVLARLTHPNLPRVVDFGDSEGSPYLAMEFVSGRDLHTAVKEVGPSVAWISDVLIPIARAVDYCHGEGILHRDLKPKNVVIEEATGRPVLVDFGLLKRDPKVFGQLSQDERVELSLSGETKGTPSFMAPEQADASFGSVGPRSDVYGLGSTLYYCLTGAPPFDGATVYNILVKLMGDPPPDPGEVAAVPPDVAELCTRCMSKVPDERPASAGELASLLEAATAPRRSRGPLVGAALLGVLVAIAVLAFALRDPGSPSPPPAVPVAPPDPPVDTSEDDERALELEVLLAERDPTVQFLRASKFLNRFPGDPSALEVQSSLRPWEDVGTAPSPRSRDRGTLVFSTRLRRLVLYGGKLVLGPRKHRLVKGQLLGWDGSDWSPLQPATAEGPSNRFAHALAYDSGRGRLVLFGGIDSSRRRQDRMLDDVWEWDGTSWEQPQPQGRRPPGRAFHSLSYDPERGVVLLFAGQALNNELLGDLWTWDGKTWREHDLPVRPGPRVWTGMTWDPLRKTTVVFGGNQYDKRDLSTYYGDLWEWDGTTWRERRPEGRAPQRRYSVGLAHDGTRLLVFGGIVGPDRLSNELWSLQGNRWTRLRPLLAPRLAWFSMAYDPERNVLIAVGGSRQDSSEPPVQQDSVWQYPCR